MWTIQHAFRKLLSWTCWLKTHLGFLRCRDPLTQLQLDHRWVLDESTYPPALLIKGKGRTGSVPPNKLWCSDRWTFSKLSLCWSWLFSGKSLWPLFWWSTEAAVSVDLQTSVIVVRVVPIKPPNSLLKVSRLVCASQVTKGATWC